jgi:hypothetical protein
MKTIDYRSPGPSLRSSRWVWVYIVGVPVFGMLYGAVFIAFAIGAMQYAGAPPGSTPSIDTTFRVLEFPMFTYFDADGWGLVLGFINGIIWGFVPICFFHIVWRFAVKLGQYT